MRIALLAVLALAGCQSTSKLQREVAKVQPPQVVTKVVEVQRDLPTWATEPVPNDPPKASTVNALKDANNARAATLDYVNCRSLLLRKVEKGEKVDIKDCRL